VIAPNVAYLDLKCGLLPSFGTEGISD
jgi:hypothetical protein